VQLLSKKNQNCMTRVQGAPTSQTDGQTHRRTNEQLSIAWKK